MHDVRGELGRLWQTLAHAPRKGEDRPGQMRSVMFLGCQPNIGVSSIAASFALLAAGQVSRTAWLLDLDLERNTAYRGFRKGFAKGIGLPGRALDASLHEEPIYRLLPDPDTLASAAADGSSADHKRAFGKKLLAVHQIEATRLLVTRFAHERLAAGQHAEVIDQPAWWAALGQSADWLIVDAPSLSRSRAGLAIAHRVEAIVLVLDGPRARAGEVSHLCRQLEVAGGYVVGCIMAGV